MLKLVITLAWKLTSVNILYAYIVVIYTSRMYNMIFYIFNIVFYTAKFIVVNNTYHQPHIRPPLDPVSPSAQRHDPIHARYLQKVHSTVSSRSCAADVICTTKPSRKIGHILPLAQISYVGLLYILMPEGADKTSSTMTWRF